MHDTLSGELFKVEIPDLPWLMAENDRRRVDQERMGVSPGDTRLLEWEWFVDVFWYYYYLTPIGEVLSRGDTPFWHESHPFSFKIYPFYGSRVYPFVSDFIDQNKYINRIITTHEMVKMRAAKGLLMIPNSALGDNDEKYFAERWAIPGGVIVYQEKAGIPPPAQVSASSVGMGDYEMLQVQLKLLEDISGVHGAMQGVTPRSGTPASLYAQETQNSVNSLTDVLESFKDFLLVRDMKLMKVIQQYYTERRYVKVAGKQGSGVYYDPEAVRDAELNLIITENSSTTASKMAMNEFLMALFSSGKLDLKELLQVGNFPFSDKLMQVIESREAAMAEGEPATGAMLPPELQAQVAAGMDPRALQMLGGMTGQKRY